VANVCLKRVRLELVESFTCLGSTITWDGRSTSELAKADTAFMAKRPLLCLKSIRLETRKEYVKTFAWAVALYGSEAWTDQN
jgi:hypothetical protein